MSYSLEYVITAKDEITNTLRTVKREIDAIKKAARDLGGRPIQFRADLSRIRADLQAIGRTTLRVNIRFTAT